MKHNKKASGGFAIIAFGIIAVLLILGGIGYVLTQSPNGVYKEIKNGDIKIKALDVYQYIGSTTDVEKANKVLLQIENINENKDYNLKIIYEAWGKNETLNVEVLGGKTELVKVPDLFSADDINGVDIYSKVVEVKNGDESLASFEYKLNVGKVVVDGTNAKVRIPELIVAETTSDSIILWYDVEDNSTISNIIGEATNTSKVTITNVDYDTDTLVENTWAKVTLNYDVKGSVFENEYLGDGFVIKLEVVYDGTNESTYVDITEDLVKTSALSDLAKLHGTNFEEISSVN